MIPHPNDILGLVFAVVAVGAPLFLVLALAAWVFGRVHFFGPNGPSSGAIAPTAPSENKDT